MLDIVRSCLAVSLAALLASCAPSQSALPETSVEDASAASQADSLETAEYTSIFIEIHAAVIAELEEARKTGDNAKLEEIRSIVKIAEEMFLEGNPLLGVKLLTEAELLLRQTH